MEELRINHIRDDFIGAFNTKILHCRSQLDGDWANDRGFLSCCYDFIAHPRRNYIVGIAVITRPMFGCNHRDVKSAAEFRGSSSKGMKNIQMDDVGLEGMHAHGFVYGFAQIMWSKPPVQTPSGMIELCSSEFSRRMRAVHVFEIQSIGDYMHRMYTVDLSNGLCMAFDEIAQFGLVSVGEPARNE